MTRIQGSVKWFSNQKGYGFVNPETGEDVFVHHSDIQGEGYKTLVQGERVEFSLIESDKGLRAQEVVRLEPPPSEGKSANA